MKSNRDRYSRQTILEQVGEDGQAALAAARVLIVGLGGLGSAVSLYLAAAGVGTLGLIDFDLVEISNLHGHALFSENQVGQAKVMAARARLNALNKNTKINVHKLALNNANALSIIAAYDLVVDCSENLAARCAINDACLALGKPFVYGTVDGFAGQISLFCADDGPCYRCFHPDPETHLRAESGAESGILGAMAGVIGSLQATEVIKYLLGRTDESESLSGKLLIVDGLQMRFDKLELEPQAECLCRNPNNRHTAEATEALANAERTLAVEEVQIKASPSSKGGFDRSISPAQLAETIDQDEDILLLDVRALKEHRAMRLRGSTLIPLDELDQRLDEMHELTCGSEERPIVVYCRSGVRSRKACSLLRDSGFENVRNLTGGILAWYREFEEKAIESDAALGTY